MALTRLIIVVLAADTERSPQVGPLSEVPLLAMAAKSRRRVVWLVEVLNWFVLTGKADLLSLTGLHLRPMEKVKKVRRTLQRHLHHQLQLSKRRRLWLRPAQRRCPNLEVFQSLRLIP